MRAARLEGDVKRGARSAFPARLGVADGLDFSVRFACLPVPALADDLATVHQSGTNQRIG